MGEHQRVDEFRVLYRSTLPDVFGYLMGHTGGNRSLAEDLTSETYLAAARRMRSSDERLSIQWLKTVARRRLVDHYRREAAMSRRIIRLRNEVATAASDTDDEAPAREHTLSALAGLSEEHRLVLTLRHIDDMSVSEIAIAVGRTEKATESLLGRARVAFKKAYSEVSIDA